MRAKSLQPPGVRVDGHRTGVPSLGFIRSADLLHGESVARQEAQINPQKGTSLLEGKTQVGHL